MISAEQMSAFPPPPHPPLSLFLKQDIPYLAQTGLEFAGILLSLSPQD